MKSVPVMVTGVPPAGKPAVGLSEVTAGVPSKVNSSPAAGLLVPARLVTAMSTMPAGEAGETAVISVPEMTV